MKCTWLRFLLKWMRSMGCLHWQHSCGRAVRRSGQQHPADKQTPVNTASWNGRSCGISPRVGPVNPFLLCIVILFDGVWLLNWEARSLCSGTPHCLTHGVDSTTVGHDHVPGFLLIKLISWLDWTVTDTVGLYMNVLFAFGINCTGRTVTGCHLCGLLDT